jgi:hypothetical protein
MPAGAVVIDEGLEACFLPESEHGGRLVLWRRDGAAPFEDATPLRLEGPGAPEAPVLAVRRAMAEVIRLVDGAPGKLSATLESVRDLLRLARALVARGSVRPMFHEQAGLPAAAWKARPGPAERALLVALARAMPDALRCRKDVDRWRTAMGLVDAAVDVLARANGPVTGDPSSFEADLERGLASGEGRLAVAVKSPRARRSLLDWEKAAKAREVPRGRLVLALEPAEQGFRLAYRFEGRDADGGSIDPVSTQAIFADALEAHRAADDLAPLRQQLRDSLRKVGALLAPVELSLAAPAPDAASLDGSESWALLTRDRPALEALGVRLEIAPALQGLEERFPRARVRLQRADGGPAGEATLARKYVGVWEVASGDAVLTAAELRQAATAAPIARVRGAWLPITAEAGERLARVAERPSQEWTGPQGLAAALAGEVRQPGDLADAAVVVEPGLRSVLAELAQEVEVGPPPAALSATLRAYQARGVAWLVHRTRLGLGALLADDMGLGKTVQLIALLCGLVERMPDSGPTLLVCPASLVGHWERELGRFAPSLRVLRHHGASRQKGAAELRAQAGPHDVLVTTYGLVRRDAAMLAEVGWGTIVCDEAQNVKNPSAAQARAVRGLPAQRRVALTGTPVENRLTELWSLMEFLNPGLLGPLERFRREIALPIERERDARAARWLRAATAPFLLRRLKSDPTLLPELPEKQVNKVWCALSDEQALLYKAAVDRSLSTLAGVAGIERQGRVLKLLTDLKQICNHPAHFLGDDSALGGRSGKLERAAEILEELVDAGDRALVFTQYVEMGNRLVTYLGQRLGREVPLFHGGLPLAERDAIVRAFQEDPSGPPVLVLSLRAGGTGLNLTKASHVLHFDRWWNPAVEDQATDRAHRIGQVRRLQVHQLVCLGTLEERIDRLLDQKRGLAEAAVGSGEQWLTQLSTDELRALVALGSDAAVENVEALE